MCASVAACPIKGKGYARRSRCLPYALFHRVFLRISHGGKKPEARRSIDRTSRHACEMRFSSPGTTVFVRGNRNTLLLRSCGFCKRRRVITDLSTQSEECNVALMAQSAGATEAGNAASPRISTQI